MLYIYNSDEEFREDNKEYNEGSGDRQAILKVLYMWYRGGRRGVHVV